MSSDRQLPLDDAIDLTLSACRTAGVAAVITAQRIDRWNVVVRDGKADQVQSNTSQSIQVTTWAAGGRQGQTSSTDLSAAAVSEATSTALALTTVADPDPWAGPAPAAECGPTIVDLAVDDPHWPDFTPEHGIAMAIASEAAARAVDPRVRFTEGCETSARRQLWQLANTAGVRVARRETSASSHVVVVGVDGDEKQMSYEVTSARHWRDLRPAAEFGAKAGRKVAAKFGWRKAPSGPAPVVLDPKTASAFLAILAASLAGGGIFRKRNWCAGQINQQIASPLVTVTDDPLLVRGPGSRACDNDGVRSRCANVIDAGRLTTYLVDGYAARRLDHPYTGHSGGTTNFRLRPGTARQDDLLREMGRGLLVTDFNGWGVDLTSGTFSRGAGGFWIENGRISYPVQEITIAGKLADLWKGIRLVANDANLEQATSSPSALIDGFTIGGG